MHTTQPKGVGQCPIPLTVCYSGCLYNLLRIFLVVYYTNFALATAQIQNEQDMAILAPDISLSSYNEPRVPYSMITLGVCKSVV